jgi:hypothetical protein
MKQIRGCEGISLPPPFMVDEYIEVNQVKEITLNTSNYYILSNDQLSVKSLPNHTNDSVFIGIAAPHVLHVVYEIYKKLSPSRLIFIDNNINQLAHLSRLIQWLFQSTCRYEFICKVFCGSISQKGIHLLESIDVVKDGFILGAEDVEDNASLRIEKKFWEEFEFDEELFLKTYGRSVKQIEGGLLTELASIGEIKYSVLTLLCGAKKHYPDWPFTLGFGSGYLRNEASFNKLKTILVSSPASLIVADMTLYCKELIRYFRYFPLVIWASNIFCDWFSARYPNIKSFFSLLNVMGNQIEPEFPEYNIYLYQDDRNSWAIPSHLRPGWSRKRSVISVHTKTFYEVSRRIRGINNLEVINEPRWIKEDKGESKLLCTEYLLLSSMDQVELSKSYDCIFLHILIGHNVRLEMFNSFLVQAKDSCDKLIILEHYRYSPEFLYKRGLICPSHIRDIIGQEQELLYITGKYPWARNFLMVY